MKLTINVNETVKVKLNPMGLRIHRLIHDKFEAKYPSLQQRIYTPPPVDSEGYVSMQLWVLMHDYGEYLNVGVNSPFEEISITCR